MTAAPKTIEAETNAVVILPEQARDVTPLTLLDRALSLGKDLPTIEKFMDLRDREERNQARKAFNEAFANFKAEAVKVARNKLVTDGPLKGKRYAELFSFVDAATPALSANGLSASWAITRDEKDWIEVTCTIEHILGGSKQVSAGGPPDTGGAKNALQARISTITYLEKITFKAACGLAEQGDDDDGRGGAGAPATITDDEVKALQVKIVRTGTDLKKFLGRFVVEHLEELSPAQAQRANILLDAKEAAEAKEPAS